MTLAIHLYRRMMRRGRLIALLALAAIPGMVYWLTAFDIPPSLHAANYADVVTTSGFSYAIAALIITVATLREERDGGTLPYLYMRPIPRMWIALAAMLAAMGAAITIGFGGWLGTLLAVAAVGADPAIAVTGMTLFMGAAVGYSALFVPLGYTATRATLLGLGYVIVVEMILGSAIEAVAHLSIWRIAASVYADLAGTLGSDAVELLGPVPVTAGGGLVKLGAVLVAGILTLLWALRRRDAL
ncbi:MAG: ABC transporter permease [Acidimicrobiia bacterium]|nr:ABC transporter permease [Acidimicrobiia bacterium]